MNEAAKLVTDAVIGNRYKTIVAGRKVYTIYSPCIKVICRALNEFSHIELPGSDTMIGFLSGIGEITPYLVRGVAALIAGNVDNWEQERDRIAAELEEATPEELKDAREISISLMNGRDFFACAALTMNVATMAAKQR